MERAHFQRRLLIGGTALLILVAWTWTVTRSGTYDAPRSSPEGDFERLRRPTLGFAVEKSRGNEIYRVVRLDKPAGEKVVFRGSLAECEKRLVASLEERYGDGNWNLPIPTFGGKQIWADLYIYAGWCIQQNVYTGHSRLLDPNDVRHAWGSYEECRTAFEGERVRQKIRVRSDHLVLLVHGLFRSKDSFKKMAESLQNAGFEVASVNYPSTRGTIGEHADQLEKVLDRLEDTHKVSFVTHSLGGIVVRDLLSRGSAWKTRLTANRLVMLAPPNRSSLVAEVLMDWFPFQVVAGESGKELTPDGVAKVPSPTCSFGVIAGGKGTDKGFNGLLGGDNDGTVLVENTRLPSAADFLLVDSLHSFTMDNDRTIQSTIRFLKEGKF